MGEQGVSRGMSPEELRDFTRKLLEDVQALEMMLERGMIESGKRRIGAEQEMFLVDSGHHPACVADELIATLDDPRFTNELARFNLEANASVQDFGAGCLSALEHELQYLVQRARIGAATMGTQVVLAGILPTIDYRDLGLDSMTPRPRYFELNDALRRLRGGEFRTHLKGIDELEFTHDNVMLEACNTSFQIHFQVGPSEFAKLYNVAQAVTGPVLAAAVNSPVLLGHRLWSETRIALFQQSIDARSSVHASRGQRARVHFGDGWVKNSVIELYREDIARFRVLLSQAVDGNPVAQVEAGICPQLTALRLHNGTVYRWNRPCYGVVDGVAHLRIENRVLPAGPTVLDEVANAAFYFGLMAGMLEQPFRVEEKLSFDNAKNNFISAARTGLNAEMVWLDGETLPARKLITTHLLPMARFGLEHVGIDAVDIDRYLGVLQERVERDRTGSQWSLASLAAMDKEGGNRDERLRALTAVMIRRQGTGEPVAKWSLASLNESDGWLSSYRTVSQFMDTDLFTVQIEDIVDFAAALMEWEGLRHIPVEDDEGRLVGLVTNHDLLRLVGHRFDRAQLDQVSISGIMRRDPHVVTPETTTVVAVEMMRRHRVGCLPVVRDGKLVGMVTDRHIVDIAARMLTGRQVTGVDPVA
jgi:CBS domain-containing protein